MGVYGAWGRRKRRGEQDPAKAGLGGIAGTVVVPVMCGKQFGDACGPRCNVRSQGVEVGEAISGGLGETHAVAVAAFE